MTSSVPSAPLGDVASVRMGQSPPGSTYNTDGVGTPLVNGPAQFGPTYPVADKWTTAPTTLSASGDIVFCVRGSTTGRMVRADGEYCMGRGVAAISAGTHRDTDYLYYALTARLPDLLTRTTGSTFPNLSQRTLREFHIPWPSEHQRGAIAEVLGSLDDQVELARSLAGHCLKTARLLYRQWLDNNDSVMASIYEVSGVSYGAPYKSSLFLDQPTGMPVIRIRDVSAGDTSVYTSERHRRDVIVNPGDIIVGMDGEFRANLWRGSKALLNQRVCKFSPHRGVPKSLVLFGLEEPLRFYEKTITGTTVIHLGKKHIDRFELPAGEDQDGLLAAADSLLEMVPAVHAEIRSAQALRDTLLPELLSGRLRVDHPERLLEGVA